MTLTSLTADWKRAIGVLTIVSLLTLPLLQVCASLINIHLCFCSYHTCYWVDALPWQYYCCYYLLRWYTRGHFQLVCQWNCLWSSNIKVHLNEKQDCNGTKYVLEEIQKSYLGFSLSKRCCVFYFIIWTKHRSKSRGRGICLRHVTERWSFAPRLIQQDLAPMSVT